METIRALVKRIGSEQDAPVPDVDPDGPRENAKVVIVLHTPGEDGEDLLFTFPDGLCREMGLTVPWPRQ